MIIKFFILIQNYFSGFLKRLFNHSFIYRKNLKPKRSFTAKIFIDKEKDDIGRKIQPQKHRYVHRAREWKGMTKIK